MTDARRATAEQVAEMKAMLLDEIANSGLRNRIMHVLAHVRDAAYQQGREDERREAMERAKAACAANIPFGKAQP